MFLEMHTLHKITEIPWKFRIFVPLPNGNVVFFTEEAEEVGLIDFFSKGWEYFHIWVFLGRLDATSTFFGLPQEIVYHVVNISYELLDIAWLLDRKK